MDFQAIFFGEQSWPPKDVTNNFQVQPQIPEDIELPDHVADVSDHEMTDDEDMVPVKTSESQEIFLGSQAGKALMEVLNEMFMEDKIDLWQLQKIPSDFEKSMHRTVAMGASAKIRLRAKLRNFQVLPESSNWECAESELAIGRNDSQKPGNTKRADEPIEGFELLQLMDEQFPAQNENRVLRPNPAWATDRGIRQSIGILHASKTLVISKPV